MEWRIDRVKIGIMQPYFLPYIGYWQLMNLVDQYVIYDDVNFINRGFIHRNRILYNGEPKYFNLPMKKASQNKLINEIKVNFEQDFYNRNMSILTQIYKKAPYFNETMEVIDKVLSCKEENVALFLKNSFEVVNIYLGIQTELLLSSDLGKNNNLRGQDKIISICELLNATEYYNAIGGQELYNYDKFNEREIKLGFLKMKEIVYKQFESDFVSNLSIVDVMMFNNKEKIREMLKQYEIIFD